ncbi:MAG: arylamine N-acetyltransferase [Pseudomonadota bacterium]
MSPLAKLYLKHLGLKQQEPSFEYLCLLQKKHIETIPHENIDGIYNIASSFDIPDLLNKYLIENRGGMCFELNYSFGWLLHELGFQVEMLLADVRAYDLHKENNAYPTHPINIVHLDSVKFVADVGWCDSYRHPLALETTEYTDATGKYRIIPTEDEKYVMQKWFEPTWVDQFVFDKPIGPRENYSYPERFLAAHAYTHVGNGYLFTTLFKFTKVHAEGHRTIWGDQLLTRQAEQKDSKPLVKLISTTLEEDFQVPAKIAQQCVPITRSLSMMFSRRPVKEKELLQTLQSNKLTLSNT